MMQRVATPGGCLFSGYSSVSDHDRLCVGHGPRNSHKRVGSYERETVAISREQAARASAKPIT